MIFPPFSRALVLAAHTDDEFGCAGTIAHLVARNVVVHYHALSGCEESVPAGFPRNVLRLESAECLGGLGVPAARRAVHGFHVRHFPRDRQAILEMFVRLRATIGPAVVFCPCSDDCHQDHQVVHQEAVRAFRGSTILGYELPQNLRSFTNAAFVALGRNDMRAKLRALRAYRSQAGKAYATRRFLLSLAHTRGVQAGVRYAEAFEVIRLMVRGD
uniref:Putative N-acetylglucosaminylphosphatidylinositol de-N-acetylase n=1 Tax=viral metagenome TaxID=1070528 RepID=A0A6M3INR3_9ZZZZ